MVNLFSRPAVACLLRADGFHVSGQVFYGCGVHLSPDDSDFRIKLDSLPSCVRILILLYLSLEN